MNLFIEKLINKYLPYGSYRSNTFTMITGTGIAQFIPLMIAPVLTREYLPKDFGILGLYIAIVYIIGVASTCRYDLAIMLPEREEEAANILVLCLTINIVVTVLCLVLIMITASYLGSIFHFSGSVNWLYFIPPGVFLLGLYKSFYYWLLRKKMFGILSLRKILQSSIMVIVQIGVGYFTSIPYGLIIGYLSGQLIGYAFLGYQIWKEDKKYIYFISKNKIWNQALKYKAFLKYSAPGQMVEIITDQSPTILINTFFGATIGGYFSFTRNMIDAPVSLISQSIYDVFKESASRMYREQGTCHEIYMKTLKILIVCSVIPFIIFAFAAPYIVPFFFGEKWYTAGIFAQILSITMFMGFISNPLRYVLSIVQKQHYELLWQTGFLFFVIIAISTGRYYNNPNMSVILFSLTASVMYMISLFISYRLSYKREVYGVSEPKFNLD